MKILIFHCDGKALNFCACVIVFVQVTFKQFSIVRFAEDFSQCLFISVILLRRAEYLEKKEALN